MVYPYLEFTATIRRPIIEIIIKSERNFAIYPVLIDSGADYCIFNIELAKALGIKLTKKRTNFRGVGKDKVKGFWGKVEIKIGNQTYQTKAIFAEISQFGHGILGQQGFFDHFDVKLSYQKQAIEIEHTKVSN
ncbi:hypothetical protein A3D83_03260 [Candidatus Daviesbacteria bacterium RIFCSPHIGHO2_02_FULL_41_10]|uniref:Peptidase A2 domain-containing protein n=1 Tax=Candidatus Daviesbacteria bacterium RIFCSPHIGHO2_02_FULL_41_10 TaxID=1797774 RepID=A0A1F5JVG3_9BACT|nr:MAG: hypothetical protein A3D83_03260 [Candidatus Daviesbacteria bacterium RIFCSPHIGHO2_02_FULL_41_10]